MVKLNLTKMTSGMKSQERKEDLEVAAYYHWLNRGCPTNDDLLDWVEAEKELKEGTNLKSRKK